HLPGRRRRCGGGTPGSHAYGRSMCILRLGAYAADDRNAALAAAHRFSAPRAAHYWDSRRHFSRRMAMTLAIDKRPSGAPGDEAPFAWDVYLAYRRGNRDIAQPDFWIHQLAVEHAPRFDSDEWQRRIAAMLAESGV